MAGEDWTEDEVRHTVRSYLEMLQREAAGEAYSKTEHRRRLAPLLRDRPDASIEFKHRNISAVLETLGLPRIRGYLPAKNFQASLLEEVERQVLSATFFLPEPRAPTSAPVDAVATYEEAPAIRPPRVRKMHARALAKVDHAAREERNRELGLLGERFILEAERTRLAAAGRADLAAAVEHVALTQGDGAGHDIRSFAVDGRARHIEVKTTTQGKGAAFFLSAAEWEFARQNPESYELHRVFDWPAPKVYVLRHADLAKLDLEPSMYRVTPSRPAVE